MAYCTRLTSGGGARSTSNRRGAPHYSPARTLNIYYATAGLKNIQALQFFFKLPISLQSRSTEHGSPYVHHVWVDPDARGRGLSRVLFDAYRSGVSPDLVVAGPFTSGGLAAARRAGATLVD
jgi:GNAT superfamily N-acetyltransferase